MAPPTCRKDCTLVELRADPWGSEYAFASDGGSVEIRSAGPDRKLGDADDLVVEVP
jgi:hypothetical protein